MSQTDAPTAAQERASYQAIVRVLRAKQHWPAATAQELGATDLDGWMTAALESPQLDLGEMLSVGAPLMPGSLTEAKIFREIIEQQHISIDSFVNGDTGKRVWVAEAADKSVAMIGGTAVEAVKRLWVAIVFGERMDGAPGV